MFVVLTPVAGLLALWLILLFVSGAVSKGPGGGAFGEDFDVYFAAAKVLHTGGNPYDARLLYRTETTILHANGLTVVEPRPLVRVGSPPLFFWALQPLTRLPFRVAAGGWVVGALALAAAGFLAALCAMGWRRRALPLLVFLLLPQVDQGVLYGEITAVYFAAIGLALAIGRRTPFLTGAILSVCWIKPPVALPLALLIILFTVHQRDRAVVGFLTATVGLTVMMTVTSGITGIGAWLRGLFAFSNGMATQPGLVSLTGLYVKWAPHPVQLALEAATVLAALACTWLFGRPSGREGGISASLVWLWPLWMLAVPYSHFPDEMLLAVPALALLCRDAEHIASGTSMTVLYLGAFSLWFNLGNGLPMQLTPVVPLMFLACALSAARNGLPFNRGNHPFEHRLPGAGGNRRDAEALRLLP